MAVSAILNWLRRHGVVTVQLFYGWRPDEWAAAAYIIPFQYAPTVKGARLLRAHWYGNYAKLWPSPLDATPGRDAQWAAEMLMAAQKEMANKVGTYMGRR
jgi:hypothetical protein